MSRMKVKFDIRLLPVKAHFFFYFGGISSLWPFINVFAKQLGISAMGVGIIFGAAPLAGLVAKPLFGAIADRFKKKKIIFLFFILLNLMSYSMIAFLSQNKPQRPVTINCNLYQTYIKQCGASNAHCNESIVETFRQPRNNSLYNDNNTDEYRVDKCKISCQIHTFSEGSRFCRSVIQGNAPSLCDGVRGPRSSSSSFSSSALTDVDSSSSPSSINTNVNQNQSMTQDDYTDKPTFLNFTANIKMWDAVFVPSPYAPNENCLNLPVHDVSYNDEPNKTIVLQCLEHAELTYCFADCENNSALNRHLERILEEEDIYDSLNFWLYGTLVIFAFVAMAVVCSMGDALCFQTLGDRPQKYGKQRLWGTIGWGVFPLLSGYLIDTYTTEGNLLKDYTPSFYLVGGLLIIDLAICYKWEVVEVESKQLRSSVCTLLTDLRVIVFIGACIIIGMATGLQWNFLMWYVEDLAALGESCDEHDYRIKTLQGLISAVQCFAGELPGFFISGYLIKKLGHTHCITLVLGVFGVRFMIYSLITNPWFILPVEILQGVTFGLFYSSMTSYANTVCPAGSAATIQGIFGAAFEGLGVAGGSLIGGLMFQSYGGQHAFQIFGSGALVFCFLHLVLMFALNRETSYRGVSLGLSHPDGQEMRQITASNQDMNDSE